MCRNIHTLHNYEPPATEEEVRDAALQYVRKISGSTKPSKANEAAFERAVDEVAAATLAAARRARHLGPAAEPRGGGCEEARASAEALRRSRQRVVAGSGARRRARRPRRRGHASRRRSTTRRRRSRALPAPRRVDAGRGRVSPGAVTTTIDRSPASTSNSRRSATPAWWTWPERTSSAPASASCSSTRPRRASGRLRVRHGAFAS